MIKKNLFNVWNLPFVNVGINEARTEKSKIRNASMNKRFILPDCGLFEAKSEADIDCNGKDGGCIGG
jgi:hypothetical protein